MTLHPQLAAMLAAGQDALPVFDDTTDIALLRTPNPTLSGAGPEIALGSVTDSSFPGPAAPVGIRIYRPLAEGIRPLIVYYHGGGWVIGDLESHDFVCRALCAGSEAVVVAVDYCLAPEHPFPAPFEDCVAALGWCHDNAAALGIDPARIAVAGDSAGGNLAAAVALHAREHTGPALCAQALIYPVTDCDFSRRSYIDNAEGYFLSTVAMQWFWDKYTGTGADRESIYASPLRADLGALPPAMVITAEYDPLRDEGLAYAAKLRDAGNDVSELFVPGAIHGFVSFAWFFEPGMDAINQTCSWLKTQFG